MSYSRGTSDEEIVISVERMIRFCHLAEMTWEYSQIKPPLTDLPLHLTRFGTLLFETAGFLYSLFEDRSDSVNLLRTWRAFDNPFHSELKSIRVDLEPFKHDLEKIRSRISFHGSRTRSHEKGGFQIFDVPSKRADAFSRLVRKIQITTEKMIEWYCRNRLEDAARSKIWQSFVVELKGYELRRRS